MKSIVLVFALVMGFVLNAQARSPMAAGPVDLKCEGVRFLKGMKDFSEVSFYFPNEIRGLSGLSAELRQDTMQVKGAVTSDKKNVKVVFQDGDQYLTYKFSLKAYRDLLAGRVSKVSAIYEDGFDWSNGYNLRARFSAICSI